MFDTPSGRLSLSVTEMQLWILAYLAIDQERAANGLTFGPYLADTPDYYRWDSGLEETVLHAFFHCP